jgi:ectoine hydroxylase-related dioxygenase (phytanoyl-CoA dioxygenase family)
LALSKKEIDRFFEEGYLIIPNLFNSTEIEIITNKANSLRLKAEEIAQHSKGWISSQGAKFEINKINEAVQITRVLWAGAAEPDLLAISKQEKLLFPIAQLLNSSTADHLANQIHYKLPHDKVKFSWHQDVHNRRDYDPKWQDLNGKGSFVQSIIAVDHMKIENGPIFAIPKSHQYGEIAKNIFQAAITKILDSDGMIPILLNPGDVVFMHPYLMHMSMPNESKESRIVLINGFSYPEATNTKKYTTPGSAERINLIEESYDEFVSFMGLIDLHSDLTITNC